MVKAIRVHETGGPDVMRWEDIELGGPGKGEARIRHTAIGLNFIDIYFRSGLYPAPAGLPFTPGNEGAGTVVAVGEGVTHVAPGDRVAYVGPLGSYAEERLIPADRLVRIPDGVDDKTAAVEATGAEVVLGGDLGCLMNIAGRLRRKGLPQRVFHVAEWLAGTAAAPGIGEGAPAIADETA